MFTATIPANVLADLLTGGLQAVGKDSGLPILTGIQLMFKDGKLEIAATDRYRLIVGSAPAEFDADFKALVSATDAERIIKLAKNGIKFHKNLPVTIESDGNNLTVTVLSDIISFRLLDGTFPPYIHLLPTTFNPIESVRVNPKFLASFAKIPSNGEGIVLRFVAENKPLVVEIFHDKIIWQTLVMPMRSNN